MVTATPQRASCIIYWLAAFILSFSTLAAQTYSESAPDEGRSTTSPAPLLISPPASFIRPVDPVTISISPRGRGVDWGGLAWQSSFFLGIQHTFRLMTEPGTREGMKGPFFKGWMQSAGNLHGWGDGDPFYVNYVGHPFQGAITGYIWNQNDRDYIGAQFGMNAPYWRSRARATAYSWAYSVLFEIGPVSEASLGKIQSTYPQQGFVDHVVTPIVGMGWMITEDALDKYLIQRFEEKVRNPYLRVAVRGGLNPARSFANALRFKVPWARDDRPGVWSPLLTPYLEGRRNGRIDAPKLPEYRKNAEGEFGLATFETSMQFRPVVYFGEGYCLGGGGEGALRLNSSWQFVVDVSGCKLPGLGKNVSGDSLTYVAGPRWSARPAGRWNPYAHFLLGGTTITQERVDPEREASVTAAATLAGKLPDRDLFAQNFSATGLTLEAGTGIDLRIHPSLAFRFPSLEYRRSWLPPVNGRDYRNGLALTMSVVLRMGTW